MDKQKLEAILEESRKYYSSDGRKGRLADLRGAHLCEADLRGANLYEANIRHAIGNSKEIRSAQIGEHSIVYTSTQLAIGCTQRSIEEWKDPTFLSKSQLYRWQEHSDFIWIMLERYPATSS